MCLGCAQPCHSSKQHQLYCSDVQTLQEAVRKLRASGAIATPSAHMSQSWFPVSYWCPIFLQHVWQYDRSICYHSPLFCCLLRSNLCYPCAGSEGIGKALAAQLARYNINLMLVSRSQAKLDAAAKEIQEKYPTVQVGCHAAASAAAAIITAASC